MFDNSVTHQSQWKAAHFDILLGNAGHLQVLNVCQAFCEEDSFALSCTIGLDNERLFTPAVDKH